MPIVYKNKPSIKGVLPYVLKALPLTDQDLTDALAEELNEQLTTKLHTGPQTFKCMLAASEIPSEESLTFPLMASYKLDGIRSPITDGVAMSRKMLPLPNQYMQSWVKQHAEFLDGLDGEMIVGTPNLLTTFNTTSSGIMKHTGAPDFKFYVFEHWNLGSLTAVERYDYLLSYFDGIPVQVKQKIVLLQQFFITSLKELKELYATALAMGYEGLILKRLDKPYKYGRSTLLEGNAMKWKEFIDYNCVILEVKQGKTNTNEKLKDELGHAKRSTAKAGKVLTAQVGGFLVKCIEPESVYYNMVFSCGPGSLTKETLQYLWSVRDTLPGQFMRVKSQKLGGKSLPRFPAFYGWIDPINLGSPY